MVTGVFSLVGVVIAGALLRWSARPADRFRWTAVSLTAISLVPPVPRRGECRDHHRSSDCTSSRRW